MPAPGLLPAPALGLLSSAVTLPGLLLGSFLEANQFPDLASLARSSAVTDTPSTSGVALAATGELLRLAHLMARSG